MKNDSPSMLLIRPVICVMLMIILMAASVCALGVVHRWTNITDPTAGDDIGNGIYVDSAGNAYVIGYCTDCGTQGGTAIYTMKFNSSGSHIWTNITDPTANNDDGYAIAVDSSGNAYVTGTCGGCGSTGGYAIYTMKFNSSGSHIWTNITDPTIGNDYGYGIAVDSSGNAYVTGFCDGCGSKGGWAIYTLKLNSSGGHVWTNITDPTSGIDQGNGISVDSSGNVYVSGYCNGCGSKGSYAIYTMKLNSSGSHVWTNITDPTSSSDGGLGISVDSSSNAYVIGFCNGCGSKAGRAIYTIKFNSSGKHVWTNITDPTTGDDYGYGISVDSSSNAYSTGYCSGCGSSGGRAIYTSKFDSLGNHIWTNMTDPTASTDGGKGISADSVGNAYVVGYCTGCGSTGGNAIYTMKFGPYTALQPNFNNFLSPETTNFSSVGDLTQINSLTLANNYGKLKFPGSHAVNADSQDYDTHVKIGSRFVSVDTANLHSSFNSSVNVTLEDVDCTGYVIYYGEGTYTTREQVKALNQVCPASLCHAAVCEDTTLTFVAEHFTGYAAGDNTNLTIYDELEAGGTKHVDEAVVFYANYTNITNGAHIVAASCQIGFDDGSGPYSMTDNGANYNYTKPTGFSSSGIHGWNVTCAKAGFNTLFAEDTIDIDESPLAVPEFSGVAFVIAMLGLVCCISILRRRMR